MKRIISYLRITALGACLLILGATDLMAQSRFSSGGSSSRSRSSSSRISAANMMGEAIFEVDPETGSLIVITDEETDAYIQEVLKSLDRPVPQCLIKVLFLEVTHNDDLDIGVQASFDRLEDDGDRSILNTLFGSPEGFRGGNAYFMLDDISVTVRALAERGKLEVLSRPSIMARNNIEAEITVGSRVPFIDLSRVTSDGQTINTVTYEDIGIILRVTPFISSTGKTVELQVAPEISTLTGETVPISNTINAPVFATRSAQTSVVVPNGRTVVIGGLMENQVTESVQKVPLLGDIWGLGSLFRRTVNTKKKTELLIFLTPYIVQTTDEFTDLTKWEQENMELIPDAYTKEELNHYLPDGSDHYLPDGSE